MFKSDGQKILDKLITNPDSAYLVKGNKNPETLTQLVSDASAINKVRKRATIRNRYIQSPHLTPDTNGKVTRSQLDITNEGKLVSPFPAGDHNQTDVHESITKQGKNNI